MSIATGRTLHRVALLLLAMLACLAALAISPTSVHADTLYVDIDRGFDLDGRGSLAAPYEHISFALARANNGDTVMVSKGEYSAASGETLPLVLPIGVTLQGDTSPFFLTPESLETVIRGHDAGPLLFIEGGDSNTIVDGVAFYDNASPTNGGAIVIRGGEPQVRDCSFYSLSAAVGAGIYASKGIYAFCEPRFERCLFYACSADIGSKLGGAMYLDAVDAWIGRCYFFACTTDTGGGGGAIALRNGSAATIVGSYFIACAADGGTGGGITSLGSSVGIISSAFLGCDAYIGGGVYFEDNLDPSPDGMAIFNSAFLGNSVSGGSFIGAAIRILNGTAIIRSCTVYENSGGSIIANFDGVVTVENSIIWNTDASADDLQNGGTLLLSYSCIYDADAGVGVIHTDPQLPTPGLSLYPMPTSPCIDTGNNAAASTTDFEDRPRVIDGNGDGDPIVDMGAWERNPIVDRAAGSNRYATAVEASQEHFEHAEKVVLATGAAYPDALCAAPLAGYYYAPILLTPSTSLAPAVANELERLETEEVFVIGGTGAISESVVNELTAMGLRVERFAGANRYATSQAVAQKLADLMGPMIGDTFLVARGDDFPDALAASPFAFQTQIPILLTPPDRLPSGFNTKVAGLGFTDAIVMGGTGAISEAVRGDIDILIPGPATRVFGANRYETAVAFARYVDTDPMWTGMYDDDYIGLAIGSNFPDALCGGAVCGSNDGPLLLTGPTTLPTSVRTYISEKSDTLAHVQAFGGTGVISDSVLAEAEALIP